MSNNYRVARALHASELEDIIDKAEAGGVGAALLAVYDVLLADVGSSYEAEDSIRPGDYAIAYGDTAEILEACNRYDANQSPIERVNSVLTWCNIGPATLEQVPA